MKYYQKLITMKLLSGYWALKTQRDSSHTTFCKAIENFNWK